MADHQHSKESPDAAWRRLRRHLDRANRFWLGFVFAPDLHGADVLCERTEWNCRRRVAPFVLLEPRTPQELSSLIDVLEMEAAGPGGCTWIAAAHIGRDLESGGDWTDAWTVFLQTLNHRRDTLRRAIGGLVLVVPPEARRSAMTVSTDLWSVRDYLTELAPFEGTGGNVRARQTESRAGAEGPDEFTTQQPRRLSGITLSDEGRSEGDQQELVTLLAAAPSELTGALSGRLQAAISAAFARGDDQAAGALLVQLGLAQADDDPAAARERLRQAMGTTIDGRLRLRALEGLFGISLEAAHISEALDVAREAVEVAEHLSTQLDTPDSLRDLSISLDHLGVVHRARGDWSAAELICGRSLEIAERLASQLGTPESLRDLSVSLDSLGRVHRARGDWSAAESMFGRSLEIRERLASQLGTPESLRDLSISLSDLGRVREARGDWSAAESVYGRSLVIAERLASQLGTPESLRDLSISLNNLGRERQARADWSAAIEIYGRSSEILRTLIEEGVDTAQDSNGLSAVSERLASATAQLTTPPDGDATEC